MASSNQFLKFLKDTEEPSREIYIYIHTHKVYTKTLRKQQSKGLNYKKLPPRKLFEEREGVGVK